MKMFHCASGNVKVEEIGLPRSEFEPPLRSPAELRVEIARRRARSRAIREQNRLGRGNT